MIFSPQSQALYQTLLHSNQPLSVKQIAAHLHIFPATVYRLTEPLLIFGLITEIDGYPLRFMAKPVEEGLSLFLLQQAGWFTQQFSNRNTEKKDAISVSENIQFSFIQSRDELMNQSAKEINKATKSVDLLRSGHEIPADVMLATIEARRRGVTTRMLIQDYNGENAGQVAYWKQNGILVRKTSFIHIRLMIYDAKVVYFMSYKHNDSGKDLGMKINYPPFAVILSEVFERWWKKAEKI